MSLTALQVLNRLMDERIPSLRIQGAATLANLANRDRIQDITKTVIDWNVELGGEAAAVGAVTDATTNTSQTQAIPAQLRVGRHRIFHRFDISRVDLQQNATLGSGALRNLMAMHVDRGLNSIARRLNRLLYTGTGVTGDAEIVGFNRVLDNSQPYAGIDPAVNSRWRALVSTNRNFAPVMGANPAAGGGDVYTVTIDGTAYTYTSVAGDTRLSVYTALRDIVANSIHASYLVVTPSGTGNTAAVTLTLTRQVPLAISANLGTLGAGTTASRPFTRRILLDHEEFLTLEEQMYDIVVMHPTTAKIYSDVFATANGNLSLIDQAEANTGLKRADLGFGGRFYNGIPVAEDPQAQPGRIYFMNSSDIVLHGFVLNNQPGNPISEIEINTSYGIPIHISELPSNNSAMRSFEFYCMPALQIYNRQAVQSIDLLSTAYA